MSKLAKTSNVPPKDILEEMVNSAQNHATLISLWLSNLRSFLAALPTPSPDMEQTMSRLRNHLSYLQVDLNTLDELWAEYTCPE